MYKARTSPPSDPEDKTRAEIFEMLVVALGDDHAKPIKICFESKESWRQAIKHTAEQRVEIYQRMLAEYYSKVYSL